MPGSLPESAILWGRGGNCISDMLLGAAAAAAGAGASPWPRRSFASCLDPSKAHTPAMTGTPPLPGQLTSSLESSVH